jgi:hypothetical protein
MKPRRELVGLLRGAIQRGEETVHVEIDVVVDQHVAESAQPGECFTERLRDDAFRYEAVEAVVREKAAAST